MLFTTKVVSHCVYAATLLAVVSNSKPLPYEEEYEFVIVGSGPGGGTLAANLAREGHSVFLIEAGGDYGDTLIQSIPGWAGTAAESASSAWQFYVNHYQNETQARRDVKYAYRFDNGSIYYGLDPPEGVTPLGILYPRGMSVGGSSQVNAMNFIYPPKNDWSYIAELTGDDSWSPENMRQNFMDLERNEYLPRGTPGHGFDGYISSIQNNISYVLDRDGVSDTARSAVRLTQGKNVTTDAQLAKVLRHDMNRVSPDPYLNPGAHQLPAAVTAQYHRSGTRNYVVDTLNARNSDGSKKYPLTLSTFSLAHRVLFKEGTGKPVAYGVEYLMGEALYSADPRYNASQNAESRTVKASREVIVAGGAFNTPQILKLSGVGPRHELEELGIPVVVDLPAVGSTLQDNYENPVNVLASTDYPNNPSADCLYDPTASPEDDPCLAQWLAGEGGPYFQASATLGITLRSSVSINDDADIHIFGIPNTILRGFYPGFSHDISASRANGWGWSVVKMQVDSPHGTVKLRSKDPREAPEINFNFFEGHRKRDLTAMSEATSELLKILNSVGKPFAPYDLIDPTMPYDLEQSVMDNAYSHHASCSCRMGPKDDRNYCVDSEFKVNGVENLRVVDASIFPRPIGAFPLSSTYVMSHKAFRTIRAEMGY